MWACLLPSSLAAQVAHRGCARPDWAHLARRFCVQRSEQVTMSALPLLDFDSSAFTTAKGQDDQKLPDTTQNNDSKPGSMKNVPCFQVFCSGLSPHTAGCRDRPILETSSPSVAIRKAQLSHSPHRRSALDYVYVYNRISRRQQMARTD